MLEALSSFSFQPVFGNHCEYIIIEKKGMADTLVSYWEQESREEPGKEEPNVKEMDLGDGEGLGGNSFELHCNSPKI